MKRVLLLVSIPFFLSGCEEPPFSGEWTAENCSFTELSFSDDNTVILINRHERLTAPYSHVEKNKYEVDLGYRTEVWEIEQKGKKLILDGCEYTSK